MSRLLFLSFLFLLCVVDAARIRHRLRSEVGIEAARGAWSGNSVTYAVGDTVTYQGSTFTCLQGHTSNPSWDPVDAASLWKKGGSTPAPAPTPAPTPSPTPSPKPAPAPTPSPSPTPAPSSGGFYYTVVSGDYCYAIATKYGEDPNTLSNDNPGQCANLQIGAKLWVRGSSSPAPAPAPAPSPSPSPSGGSLVTYSQFSSAVTSNGFPTPSQDQYNNFVASAGPAGGITTVRELAMFLGEILHESGGLIYKSEIACTSPNSCPGSYDSLNGQQFYGRGYIQITWSYNYQAASTALYGDSRLVSNPSTVATTEKDAWGTAFWFWKANVHSDSGVQAGQFGSATNKINGGLECGSNPSNPSGAQTRFNYYKNVLKAFGDNETPNSAGC